MRLGDKMYGVESRKPFELRTKRTNKSVISVHIKDFNQHYSRANFYNISGSTTSWKTKKDVVREYRSGYGRIRARQEGIETERYEEEVQPYLKTDCNPIIIIAYKQL